MTAPNESLRVIDQRVTKLSNVTCAYCGELLTKASRTWDHVIAKRFVPTGAFADGWNLIVRACLECNVYKSTLEDDLSAISMCANPGDAAIDEHLERERIRKATGSVSRRTGKPVADSTEELKLSIPLYAGAVATVTLTAPPQLDESALFELAKLHVIAFMYWLTYDPVTRQGRFGTGVFRPVAYARRSDWGNARLLGFMDAVVGWEPRVLGDCASGYFRIAIRKHPEAACWSWAMEWNKNIRLAGYIGNESEVDELVGTLPRLGATVIERRDDGHTAFRTEQGLVEADDHMFHWSAEETRKD